MQIKIKTLTSRFLTFDVEPTMTVLQLKHLVQDKEAIDAIQIRLIYKGQQLNDTMTVEGAKIEAGAVINMIVALRGGAASA